MGKSNYPSKLDTSIEIPAVRDNIVEVGSDVLNSLRSAIFNIERTLGINPQGATGNTVASRINHSLDGNGNILKEALDKAGLLSGPITNADVSKVAGIDETKLKLNYPTTLLQDEISQIIKQIDIISATLEELAFLYAAHTHPEAKNRHKGHAITIDAIDRVESDIGIVSSERQTSQELFEKVFSSHINYSGSDISERNRSHEAKQLFFDKTDVSAYIYSEDVQGAIIDVLNTTRGQVEGHQNRHHSNGTLRTSVIAGAGDRTAGRMLLDEQAITYSKYSPGISTRLSSVTLSDEPLAPVEPIERSDILRIYSGVDEEVSDYQIHSVKYAGPNILSITIFGALGRNSDPLDKAKVFKNLNTDANPAGLLASARHFPGATNINLVQIANPDSSAIISKGIRPSEISLNNRYMDVTVDNEEPITVDVYDGAATAGQTIDSIIKAMNVEFAKKAASVLAYRVDYDDLYSPEIALVHSLPSTPEQAFTLSVARGSDSAIDSLGFGHIEDKVIDQGSGSEYYIQGEAYSGLGLKLEQAGLALLEGTAGVTSTAVGVNLGEYGIAIGDLLVVTNTSSDNGTYVIKEVSDTSVTVDNKQLTGNVWNDESTESSIFYVLKSTVSLEEFDFLRPEGILGSNAAIVDVFLDTNRDIFYNTRLEYAIAVHAASDSLIAPCDFDGDISLYTDDSPGVIKASLTTDGIPQLSLDGGNFVEIPDVNSAYVRLKSGVYNITLLVFIEDSSLIKMKIDNALGAPFQVELFGESDINHEENLLLARVHFDSLFSRITGAGADLPRIFKKLESGITSDKDLSSKALNRVYQGPISETRSNGVVDGLKLTPAAGPRLADAPHEYVVDIAGGACYVKGKKFIFEGYTDLISDVPSHPGYDKVFVAINEWGEVVFSGASHSGGGGGSCVCPFSADSHCILAVIEWDGSNPPVAIDLRLFLNDLDLKVLNSVTVSPQKGMGHFTDFGEALKYTKRFGDLFPKAGTPTIHLKSGTHKVVVDTKIDNGDYTVKKEIQAASYAGVWINFPVNITGEGNSTVLDIITVFNDAAEEDDDREAAGRPLNAGRIFVAGPGVSVSRPNGNGDLLEEGFVTFSNFKMKNCGIMIVDPWTESALAPGTRLNWGVNVDRMIFDRSGKADYEQYNYGVGFWSADSSGLEPIGNLLISGCQFLNSYALWSSSVFPIAQHMNISVSNNVFRGSGDGAISGASNWLTWNNHNAGVSNMFNLGMAPSENNIEFRNNTLAENHLPIGAAAYADPPTVGMRHRWGDRISRDLSIGGKLGIGQTADTFSDSRVNISTDTYTDAIQADGGITLSSGDIWVASGEITVNGGDVTVNGLSGAGGSVNAVDLNLTGITGDLVPAITMKSLSTNYSSASTINFERDTACINNTRLGELWFKGKNSSQAMKYGSGIHGCASETWNASSWRSDLRFFVNHSNATYSTERMRLSPDGILRLNGGDDVDLNGSSGVLQIGEGLNLETGNGLHLALDQNEIQAKNGPNAASGLYLNGEGSEVYFGPSANRLAILGSEIRSTSGDTVYINDRLEVSSRFKAGYYDAESVIDASTTHGRVVIGSLVSSQNVPFVVNCSPTKAGAALIQHGVNTSGAEARVLTLKLPNLPAAATSIAQWYIGCEAQAGGGLLGGIQATPGGINFVSFTGSHIVPVDDSEINIMGTRGLLVSSDGTCLDGTENSISETFSGATLSSLEKDKAVYGVISSEVYRPGAGDSPMIHWDDETHGITINSVGNGRVWVTNIAGEVQNGDYICSSNIPGYGQLQDDDLMHNYTAAKSTETIDWDSVTDTITHNGIKYKKYLVACTYHCG